MSKDLEDLIARAQGGDAFWLEAGMRPPARTEKNSISADGFDRQTWAWITDTIPALSKQVTDLGEDFETSPWAYEDLFYIMHKADPQRTPEDVLVKEFKPQALMMGMIGDSAEIGHLRHETMLDDYNTAYAMLTMRDKMRKAFEDLQDAIDAQREADEALAQALADAQAAIASGEGQDEAAEALAAALGAVRDAGEQAEDSAAEGAASVQGAADLAAKQIASERSLMSSWGIGPGRLQRMSYEERRALAEKLQKSRMAKFSKMLGAQRRSSDAERRRSLRKSPARTVGTTLGSDLTRLASSELDRMAIPELEEDFWIRYGKKTLRLKDWADPPMLDRGPMIVICDESASMGATLDEEGNTREMWSKAVALGLYDAARRGRRDFVYIGFASASEVWMTDFPQGGAPIEKVMEFTEHFFAGGTHYERPLTLGMEVVKRYAQLRRPKPDIVFITDDECRVPEEFIASWREVRAEADVACYGIQVGGSGDYATMQHLTDRQMSITALNAQAGFDTAELYRTI